MKKVINSPKAPKAIGPYSQAIEVNGMIYISGQLPVDVNTVNSPKAVSRNKPNNL